MFATASPPPGGARPVFVPKQAVVRDKTTDSNQVYRRQDGKARLRVVQLGEALGQRCA